MTIPEQGKLLPWYKKIFRLDFIIFACVSLALWFVLLYTVGSSVTEHSVHDQHTVQALAWLNGKIAMDEPGDERAEYNGKIYISFPPAPTFIELPFALLLGRNTPNTLTLLLFTWLAMLFSFFILLKLTGNRTLSLFASFSFFWGSQILYLSLTGAVWDQGQLYGLFFALTAILILLYTEKKIGIAIGAFFLGLAVGCRPFYLVMALFYAYQAYKRFPKPGTFVYVICGLLPPGIFYAIYNFVRFGSFFEFGHKYLSWYKDNPTDGLVNLKFFIQDFYYALINLPEWDSARGILSFHGMGTSLLFVAPFILLGFVYFFKPGISLREKLISGISIFGIWFLLLLHDTNGWYQFGYRFSVDLIPLLIFFFGCAFKKDHLYLVPISVFSVIINIYGAIWFYVLNL
jgi:hypothetical protein